jgi:hypothetical protein
LFDRLAAVTSEQQHVFEKSPSEYGIGWPLIDDELSIEGLLDIRHEPSKKSWACRGAPSDSFPPAALSDVRVFRFEITGDTPADF